MSEGWFFFFLHLQSCAKLNHFVDFREVCVPLGPSDDPFDLDHTADKALLAVGGWRQSSVQNHDAVKEEVLEGDKGSDGSSNRCSAFAVFLWTCRLMMAGRKIVDLT